MRLIQQLLRIMKLAVAIVTIFCLQASARVNGQVTISVKDAGLDEVFAIIEKQAGVSVVFNWNDLKGAKKVTLRLTNATFQQVLDKALEGQGLEYEVKGGSSVFVYKKQVRVEADELPAVAIKSIDGVEALTFRGHLTNSKKEPVAGATVQVRATNVMTTSDDKGDFVLENISENAVLIITSVNYQRKEFRVNKKTEATIEMQFGNTEMKEVTVVYNTGYAKVPKERATGSFEFIDEEKLASRISPDILSRLNGIANSVYFNPSASRSNSSGINIRGQSSVSPFVNGNPLIVVDNFPLENDQKDALNPNDIKEITILRDAAAASIWGARAANGVIVITTKRGGYNQPLRVDFNSNVTVGEKPDLTYDKRYLPAEHFIAVEDTLFRNGFYDNSLADNVAFPAYSRVVDIMDRQRRGLLTDAEANQLLGELRDKDARSQIDKHFYRKSVAQQYFVSLTGGGPSQSFYLGLGADVNYPALKGNSDRRFTINTNYTFKPSESFDASVQILYANTQSKVTNKQGWPQSSLYGRMYPYADLKNADGTNAVVDLGHSRYFNDSMAALGFRDWYYRPLDELDQNKNTGMVSSLMIKGALRYNFLKRFSAEVQYQREQGVNEFEDLQREGSYAVRDLINSFAAYDAGSSTFTYPFPEGGILTIGNAKLHSSNLRAQLRFGNSSRMGDVNILGGVEMRETVNRSYSRLSYGYSEEYGTSAELIDYITTFPTNGGYGGNIPAPPSNVLEKTQRFLSYFVNASYVFDNRFTLTASSRSDGANVVGVKRNDRIAPFWSVGGAWSISNEKFYQVSWLPTLRLRATYGYNGNVYDGAAYLVANFNSRSNLTNLPIGSIESAPNPELRWEKIGNMNVGVDFTAGNNVLSGSIEWYRKNGKDLIEDIPIPSSTGFSTFRGNAARTRVSGVDVSLNARPFDGWFGWEINANLSVLKDKLLSYDVSQLARSLAISTSGTLVEGFPIQSLFAYRWAGLDRTTGDPMGYRGKSESKDYATMLNAATVDSLLYVGNARPRIFGNLRNTFTYGPLSMVFNITYRFKYYFRRPSVHLNYQFLLSSSNGLHTDYLQAWKAPGDELRTSVPSLVYQTDEFRDEFYTGSEVLISKGDHIRLQDLLLSYTFRPKSATARFRFFQVGVYANNIGILWKANKYGLDPDFAEVGTLPARRTFALSFKTSIQ